jgi:hypothetical protein
MSVRVVADTKLTSTVKEALNLAFSNLEVISFLKHGSFLGFVVVHGSWSRGHRESILEVQWWRCKCRVEQAYARHFRNFLNSNTLITLKFPYQ